MAKKKTIKMDKKIFLKKDCPTNDDNLYSQATNLDDLVDETDWIDVGEYNLVRQFKARVKEITEIKENKK